MLIYRISDIKYSNYTKSGIKILIEKKYYTL